jgi:hypothetical protein
MTLEKTVRLANRIVKDRPALRLMSLTWDPKKQTYKAIEFLDTHSGALITIPCDTKTPTEA